MKRIDGLKLAIWSFMTTAAAFGEHGAGEHQIAAAAIAAFLTHVFAHFTADQAKEVLAGFEHGANHDLEFALAAAYREALKHVRTEIAGGILGADFAEVFDEWEDRLAQVHNAADASRFFNPSDLVDPAVIASEPDFWSNVRVVLLRWTTRPALPPELEAYLKEHLPGLIETAMERVIREGPHSKGLIAWQESFLKAIHRDGAETNRIVKGIDRKVDQLLGERPPPTKVEITAYLTTLWNGTRLIDIKNLRTSDGSAVAFDIDQMYTPLTTVLALRDDHTGPEQQGSPESMRRSERVPLQEALSNDRVLIVGDPGAGKTTFLKRVAFEACHVLLGHERRIDRLVTDPVRFPVMLRASEFADHLSASGKQRAPLADKTSPEWLVDYLGAQEKDLGPDFFRTELGKGCLLLVDGLDEIPGDAEKQAIVGILKRAGEGKYKQTRIVATSRPGRYGGVTSIYEFLAVTVQPFNDEAIELFAGKWGRAVFPYAPESAARLSTLLLTEINAKKEIRELAQTAVMLTALACLHFRSGSGDEEKKLPEQRSELYASILEWLAKAREGKRDLDPFTLLERLGKLAFAMHTSKEQRREHLEYDEAVGILAPYFREHTEPAGKRRAAEQFLNEEEVKSGIILGSDTKVRFWHQTFQEYLVAYRLAIDPAELQNVLFLQNQKKLYDPQWRETILLLAGTLKKHAGMESVDRFLDKMLQGAQEGGPLEQVCCFNLMSALLRDLKAWTYTMSTELEKSFEEIQNQAARIFTPEAGDIPLEQRVEAAEAIGRAGDRRLRLPQQDDYWVSLPGGTFTMGEGARDNETPHHVHVDAFQIGRYPVTVYEYARFLQASGHAAPEDWEDQNTHGNRPVVSVSWFDAQAYCQWVALQVAGVRLPTEAEWERAARGTERRKYAWGDDPPSPERANYSEARIGAASPVGLFPRGLTPAPESIADLTGNVWEWVSDWYEASYYKGPAERNPKGPEAGEYKCLRGGSWLYDSTTLRAAFRNGNLPGIRYDYVGFRCVREVFS